MSKEPENKPEAEKAGAGGGYEVIEPLLMDGERYEPGDSIRLTGKQFAKLPAGTVKRK